MNNSLYQFEYDDKVQTQINLIDFVRSHKKNTILLTFDYPNY